MNVYIDNKLKINDLLKFYRNLFVAQVIIFCYLKV